MPTKFSNTAILPSDNQPIEVAVLGIWELDDKIPQTFNERFSYQMEAVTGEKYQVEFDLSKFPEPPTEPTTPLHEAVKGSSEWHDWRNYQTYHAALAHRAEMIRRAEQWVKDTRHYIITGKQPGYDYKLHGDPTPCVKDKDRYRIADERDVSTVVVAAVTPRVTKENLADALRQTFPGQLAG